ncbi:MAG: hybrid sensor histidine kinase/response regulator [Desulforhabdus sp.]|jgi:two-component system sensor histidine kinase and response regulator WspE|nr:hybrid sensor histidine kinase/response regulator [Desulforhabdus sp.]
MASTVDDLSDLSMLDLFRMEAENQARILEAGLVELERDQSPARVEPLMRAAHSVKGAARIVGLDTAVNLAHAMEDVLSAVQKGDLSLNSDDVDLLLCGNDIFTRTGEMEAALISGWLQEQLPALDKIITDLHSILAAKPLEIPAQLHPSDQSDSAVTAAKSTIDSEQEGTDNVVRITAENLSRLMGLAGESLIEARSVESFTKNLLELKIQQNELAELLEQLRQFFPVESPHDPLVAALTSSLEAMRRVRSTLSEHFDEFDRFSRRLEHLADRLYNEVIASRMRPFSDGIHGFSRMVRDLARSMKKKVSFQVVGESTKIDRDILEKLEAPLTHLLRNAIDHGLEAPEQRMAAGKIAEGSLTLEARHRSGMLSITVTDDGRGVDPESIRRKIVEKALGTEKMAERLSRSELMDFLFLPGFSTSASVTEISGRGVGLNVVQAMLQEVGGSVRCDSTPGQGTRFHLRLPLSLSVVRSILVEIANEPYAIPLTRADRIIRVDQTAVQTLEDRQFYTSEGEHLGLVDACQVLMSSAVCEPGGSIPVVVVSDRQNRFGLVVNCVLGERDLVVKPLDASLGKVPNISAAAILEDGSPVLILDIDDVVRSIDNILTQGRLQKVDMASSAGLRRTAKRVLVVDDSLTVREVQRRLLENKGYQVEIAVDGMDGWNAVRSGQFDLVISDVDMPRMHGSEFVSRIKNDPRLKDTPVMIVSYKDREEDRLKGLQAGANYYLTKSSFHDESLINAVVDLIGEP